MCIRKTVRKRTRDKEVKQRRDDEDDDGGGEGGELMETQKGTKDKKKNTRSERISMRSMETPNKVIFFGCFSQSATSMCIYIATMYNMNALKRCMFFSCFCWCLFATKTLNTGSLYM